MSTGTKQATELKITEMFIYQTIAWLFDKSVQHKCNQLGKKKWNTVKKEKVFTFFNWD